MPVVRRPPTDFELLRAIYERHRDEYVKFDRESRAHKNAVPIDIPAIASKLGVDANMVHGRLYHHLDPLYGTTPGKDGKPTGFFIARPGTTPDLVHFPLLEAVLAGLWQQHRRDLLGIGVAFASIGIAAVSLVVAIIT